MAKRDVVNYYMGVQAQYLTMLEEVKDFEEEMRAGRFGEEQFRQAQEEVAKLKENYDRLSYIMLLLNEPSRESKKKGYRKRNALVYDYLSKSSDAYIRSENGDVLKRLKEIIENGRENG